MTQDRDLRSTRLKTLGFVMLFGSLVIALVGVFFVLPRWTANRQPRPTLRTKVVDRAITEEIPPTALPHIQTPAIGPASIPAPLPPPTRPSSTSRRQETGRISPPPTPPTDGKFVSAMSRGLTALEREQWQTAREAFEEASRLRPGAAEAADGLARAAAAERRGLVSTGILRGRELEASESWRAAEKTYAQSLAVDPEAAGALEGRERAAGRAVLDEQLEYHISNPNRLSSPPVFENAADVLAQAREAKPRGPRLAGQISRLGEVLEVASTPVPVLLESDNLTAIVVYRVGRLGVFSRRELSLRPGSYTAVGSRDGFRDVRVQFHVTPGATPKPVMVQCTEGL